MIDANSNIVILVIRNTNLSTKGLFKIKWSSKILQEEMQIFHIWWDDVLEGNCKNVRACSWITDTIKGTSCGLDVYESVSCDNICCEVLNNGAEN